MLKTLRSFLKNDDGAAAVEFAFVSILFFSLVIGIIEMGRVYWTWNTMQYAVENTARYALTHTSASDGDLEDYARENMSGIQVDESRMTLSISHTTQNEIDFLQIDGTYAYQTILPLLPSSVNMNLTATTRLPVH